MIMKKYDLPKCEIVEKTISPDYKLLKQLLTFQTPSESVLQDIMLKWIVEWIKLEGIEGISTEFDTYGNLYITKGKSNLYPCIVAHVDINQDYKMDFDICTSSKFMFGFDNTRGEQCGLGFDDKVGVYFALEMLRQKSISHLKVLLVKDEEIGCQGTHVVRMKWLKNCTMLMQLDRRSDTNDISSCTNGVDVVSDAFMEAMKELNNKYEYDFEQCMYTDVGELKKQGLKCIAFNISCGYFNEHCDTEILSLNHFVNAINYAYEILIKLGNKKWEHISDTKPKAYQWKNWNKYYSDFEDYLPPKKIEKEGHWHYTPAYRFNKIDEEYIQENVLIGICPICNTHLTPLSGEKEHCVRCEATYNIPISESITDVDEEIFDILDSNEKLKKENIVDATWVSID